MLYRSIKVLLPTLKTKDSAVPVGLFAIGALEGAYYIKNGILKSFSEQQLVSCDQYDSGKKNNFQEIFDTLI